MVKIRFFETYLAEIQPGSSNNFIRPNKKITDCTFISLFRPINGLHHSIINIFEYFWRRNYISLTYNFRFPLEWNGLKKSMKSQLKLHCDFIRIWAPLWSISNGRSSDKNQWLQRVWNDVSHYNIIKVTFVA